MKRSRGGFALLMVIVVSLALMAIAIPFAISMRAQERGAQGTADRAQARYSSVAARNHALAQVSRGHEAQEESKGAPAPFNTPYSDTIEEFRVTWSGVKPTEAQEGGSKLLRGAVLQDEQAKVNEKTAPAAVISRIKSKVDPRTTDLREFITQYSGRPCAWCAPQTIRSIVPTTTSDGKGGIMVQVDDPNAYGEGSRIRYTYAGQPAYGVVDRIDEQGGGIVLRGVGQDDSQLGAILEMEARHPVNINTASQVVLQACLEGLGLRDKLTEDVMTGDEATSLAIQIQKRKFVSYEEFAKFLEELVSGGTISGNDQLAILINFVNPNSRRLATTGTMPFSLTSYDYVSVAAHGRQDSPSGTIGAESDLRQIVEMAPAGTLRWRVLSQYDFERNLRQPQGSRVLTWPACIANGERPSVDRAMDAWITTQTGNDDRAGWKVANHFSNTMQGQATDKGAFLQDSTQILQIVAGNADIEAGATEFWFKTSANSFTLFDAGPEEWSNRLWMSYGFSTTQNTNVLRFVLKDSSLERTYAEVNHPVALRPDTWYHVGAYWKGTKFGHAMITLDGLAVGRYGVYTETGGSRHTTLTSALAVGDPSVFATSVVTGFPVPGAIEIGNEVIEYTAVSGNSFTGCTRGARGTTAQVHQAGAGVTVCGYTSRLVAGTLTFNVANVPVMTWDRLTTGGGATTGFIDADATSTAGPTVMPNPLPPGLPPIVFASTANQLTIPAVDLPKFPDRGWLTVGTEVIHYDGKNATQFTGITRALYGTTAVNHFEFEPVRLWGFHVTSNANYLSPTVLSIDDEWFGPMQKDSTDGWVGVVANIGGVVIPIPLFRGNRNLFQTPAADHNAGALVLPTFALADQQAGTGDVVTLVEANPATREQRTIRHTRWAPALNLATANPSFLLASLDANVAKEWVPDNLFVRILKFPSGELMGINQPTMVFAGTTLPSTPAGFSGFIDEVRLTNGPKNLGFQMSASIDATATTIPMAGASQMNQTGGAILVGSEIIGYAGIDATAGTLINCTRGYLTSVPSVHEAGDRVFNLSFLAVSALTAGVGPTDKVFACATNGFQQNGYILVGTEIIGYTDSFGTGVSMPQGCDYRGAFGSTPAGHNQNDLAYAMPFRYYDRYTANADDTRNACFGASFRATGAKWKRLTFRETLPNPSLDILVSIRFNSEPRWTTLPSNRPYVNGQGGIWLFDAPTGGSLSNARGDQIDARISFVWQDGAYQRGDWKDSPQFHGLTVEYEQEPIVHYHEEK